MNSDMSELYGSFPGREKELDVLCNLVKAPSSVPSIFVSGLSATGKTTVVKGLLHTLQVPHAYVNLTECYCQRLLYDRVIRQLFMYSRYVDKGQKYLQSLRCERMNDFVRELAEIVPMLDDATDSRTFFIAIDRAERLRDNSSSASSYGSTLLAALLRFRQLTKLRVTVIFISSIVWEKYLIKVAMPAPLLVYFPPYTKDQVIQILLRDSSFSTQFPFGKPKTSDMTSSLVNESSDADRLFAVNYLELLYKTFHTACGDLNEFRHVASLMFPVYCAPVLSKDIQPTDNARLFLAFQPFLQKMFHRLYLRDISTKEWSNLISTNETLADMKSQDPLLSLSSVVLDNHSVSSNIHFLSPFAQAQHLAMSIKGNVADVVDSYVKQSHQSDLRSMELPFFTKFLLIAAYLASYNPQKQDLRFFSRSSSTSSKIRKTMKRNNMQRGRKSSNKEVIDTHHQMRGEEDALVDKSIQLAGIKQQLLGPKQFPMDRLLAIFYSILDEPIENTIDIQIEIATLVTLKFLTRCSVADSIDHVKFKCNVSFDFVRGIARSVQFDIIRYLWDYAGVV